MISSRDRNIVVKSQFSINGSRGKDVGSFVADYVSRDSATTRSMAYVSPNGFYEDGDGVAFTLDATGIPRSETLRLADEVQELHSRGDRAIQQMVISFDPDYLKDVGLVPEDASIMKKGDYEFNYDDVRLRHAVRSGVQSMIDNEGYRDGRMVAAIQHDTLHLHVHVVVYEHSPKLSRKRGYEEKGVIKQSSLNQLAFDIDRNLGVTKSEGMVPTEKELTVSDRVRVENVDDLPIDMPYVDAFIKLIEEKEEEERRDKEEREEKMDAILDAVEEKQKSNKKLDDVLDSILDSDAFEKWFTL